MAEQSAAQHRAVPCSPWRQLALTHLPPHPLRHGGVIGGGVLEGLPRQPLAEGGRLLRRRAALELAQQGAIVCDGSGARALSEHSAAQHSISEHSTTICCPCSSCNPRQSRPYAGRERRHAQEAQRAQHAKRKRSVHSMPSATHPQGPPPPSRARGSWPRRGSCPAPQCQCSPQPPAAPGAAARAHE